MASQVLPESLADLTFPTQGIDLTAEFELQRPQTTPVGQNVRGYETLTQRQRGGSRPGLAQYVPQQVSGPHLIQHLNYIVDPQAIALSTAFDPLDNPAPVLAFGWGFSAGPFLDYGFPTLEYPEVTLVPSGGFLMPNGFYTRTGGSGLQPNANVGTMPPSPPAPVTLDSQTSGAGLAVSSVQTGFTFINSGDVVLVFAAFDQSEGAGPTSVVSVTDALGNSYTFLGAANQSGSGDVRIEVWKCFALHSGSTRITVTLNQTSFQRWEVDALSFLNAASLSVPVFNDVESPATIIQTGTIGAGTTDGMAVMCAGVPASSSVTGTNPGGSQVTVTVGSPVSTYIAAGVLLFTT
jgi:hypothetical protein